MRLPELSAREQLVALTATDVSLLAMVREQLGPDAKTIQGFTHRVLLSSDGVTWSEHRAPPIEAVDPSTHFNGIAYGASRFVAVGGSIVGDPGPVWVGTDDSEWQPAEVTSDNPLMGVEWTAALGFLAFGDGGVVLASADGLRWTKQKHAAAQLRAVACSPDTCVFGGTTNFVVLDVPSLQGSVARLDCNIAECITDPSGNEVPPPIDRVIYGHGEFVAETQDIGMGRSGFASTDGSTWRELDLAAIPQQFMRGLALRASGPAQIEVWNQDDETHTVVPVTDDNRGALSCSAFECVVFKNDIDFELLLVPDAAKMTGCDL